MQAEPLDGSNAVVVRFEGHLDRTQVHVELGRAARELAPGGALIVDCREMTSYANDARESFIEWNKRHKSRIRRVAILTDNLLYRMVISTMRLMTDQDMRAFADEESANEWVDAGAGR